MPLTPIAARFLTLPLVYGSRAGNYWDRMVRDFSEALTDRGLPCEPIDLSDSARASEFFSQAATERPRVLLDYNLNSGIEIEIEGRTVPLIAAAPCPTVNLLMDHPVHCFDDIWTVEREAAIRGTGAPPRLYVPMDPFHVRSVALGGRPAMALPQGGPAPISDPRPIRDRPIPAMTFGTLAVPGSEVAIPPTLGLGPRAKEEGGAMVAEVLSGDEDVEAVVRNRLARIQPRLEVVPFVHAIRAVDFHARMTRRWRIASSLAALPVVHYGEASPEARALLTNWEFRGSISFDRLCERMADAKIVLGDTINLRNAALMRMFYAMARGCAVATDMNAFLATEFADGESIIALSLDPERRDNAEKVGDLLADPRRLQAIAAAGRTVHGARHTWHARADALIPKIQELIG